MKVIPASPRRLWSSFWFHSHLLDHFLLFRGPRAGPVSMLHENLRLRVHLFGGMKLLHIRLAPGKVPIATQRQRSCLPLSIRSYVDSTNGRSGNRPANRVGHNEGPHFRPQMAQLLSNLYSFAVL
jgi:hypothetical protein